MRLIYYFAVILETLSVFKAVNLAPTDSDSDTETNIVGGSYAYIGQFPYQAALVGNLNGEEFHFCGGSVIESNKILTAAHCVDPRSSLSHMLGEDYLSKITVRVGIANIYIDFATRQDLKIISVEIHPVWVNEVEYSGYEPIIGKNSIPGDVAILTVEPMEFNRYVQKIEVNDGSTTIPSFCVTSGWGQHAFKELLSGSVDITALTTDIADLKWALVRITKRSQNPPLIFGERSLFPHAGLPDHGDSGGPLVCNGKLTGVVSFGGMAYIGKSDLVYSEILRYKRIAAFTDVPYYFEWIFENIN